MAIDERRVGSGEWRVASGEWLMANGECRMAITRNGRSDKQATHEQWHTSSHCFLHLYALICEFRVKAMDEKVRSLEADLNQLHISFSLFTSDVNRCVHQRGVIPITALIAVDITIAITVTIPLHFPTHSLSLPVHIHASDIGHVA